MQLIGFKAYRRGFIGCLVNDRAYVYFTFSRGAFKVIQHYPQAQFESRAHFMTSLHKFVPLRFFLRRPFPLVSLENSDLEALGRRLAASLTCDAFLSLQCFVPRSAAEAKDQEQPLRDHGRGRSRDRSRDAGKCRRGFNRVKG